MNSPASLERITDLKAEYGIGGLAAKRYMDAERGFSTMREQVVRELLDDEGVVGSEKEIAHVCDYVRHAANKVVNAKFLLEAEKRSQSPANLLVKYPFSHPSLESEGYLNIIPFDYQDFLTLLYGMGGPQAIAFTLPVGVLSMSLFGGGRLDDLLSKNELFVRDGEEVSADALQYANDVLESFDMCSIGQPTYHFPQFSGAGVTEAEALFLYGLEDDLYERAVREKMLGDIWTGRRIVLGDVLKLNVEDPEEAIGQLEALERKRIANQRRYLAEYTDEMREAMGQNLEDTIVRSQYILTALVENKTWLMNVLSR